MSDIINEAKQIKYNVYNHEDKKVAAISENNGNLSLEVLVNDIHELPIFLQEVTCSKDIEKFLSKRVLPAGRHGLGDMLEAEGIKAYSWRDLIILNSGRVLTDDYYVLTEIDGVESEKSTYTSIQTVNKVCEQEELLWEAII